MKQWLKSIFFVGLVSLAFGFVSCAADSGDSTETQTQIQVQTTYYTVSFNSNGGSSVSAQKVESGKTATKPSNPIKEGYSFRGWYNGTSEFDFSTPIKSNITLTAQWTENKTTPETPKNPETPENPETPDTPENPDSPDNPSTPTVTTYTVTFKANGGTGGDTTQTVTFGTTETLNSNTFIYTGYRFASWNTKADGTGNSYSDGGDFTVSEEKNITLYAQWVENDRYIISYANTYGAENSNPTSYRETVGATLSDLFLTGYIFEGWYSDADADGNGTGTKITGWGANEKAGDVTLWAKWTPRTDTAYKVEHWQENANDDSYTLFESENMSGTTDAQTNAEEKSYAHFTAQPITQETIAGNGSTVVKVYYERERVTLTLNLDGGTIGEKTSVTRTGKYDSQYAAVGTPAKSGYTFTQWSPKLPTTMKDGTFTAIYTANTNTPYKVEHWQENANDDSYTLIDTDNMTGTTDAQTNAEEKSYAHFTALAITQETIASNGSTVVKIYYERERVTLTLDLTGGTLGGESGTVTISGKYGSQYAAVGTPEKQGYNFDGWNPELPATLENATCQAVFKGNPTSISVTVSPNATLAIQKTESENAITLTAQSGHTSYTWKINNSTVADFTGASVNENEITISKASLASGAVYQVSLYAPKGGIPYSAQIAIKKGE